MNKRFYVYILYRPWNMIPCYVGKGSGDRVYFHSRYVDTHYNKHLVAIIKKAGGEIPHRVVFETDDELQAFAEEVRLIAAIGRSDLRLGPLCNLTNGGEGVSGWSPKEETRNKLKLALTGNKNGLGYKFTSEQVSNVSRARIGNNSGKGNFGKPHSAERRLNQSLVMMGNTNGKGAVFSDERRRKISLAMMGNTNGAKKKI